MWPGASFGHFPPAWLDAIFGTALLLAPSPPALFNTGAAVNTRGGGGRFERRGCSAFGEASDLLLFMLTHRSQPSREPLMLCVAPLLGLARQAMPASYLGRRHEWVTAALGHAHALGLREEVAHDAVLLMDAAMAQRATDATDAAQQLLVAACILISARQGGGGGPFAMVQRDPEFLRHSSSGT
jgi:hypothetical protein